MTWFKRVGKRTGLVEPDKPWPKPAKHSLATCPTFIRLECEMEREECKRAEEKAKAHRERSEKKAVVADIREIKGRLERIEKALGIEG